MFTQEEDRVPGAHPIAVVSYGCWQRRFGGDPNLVGKTIKLNGHDFTIIGVAPEEFRGTVVDLRAGFLHADDDGEADRAGRIELVGESRQRRDLRVWSPETRRDRDTGA